MWHTHTHGAWYLHANFVCKYHTYCTYAYNMSTFVVTYIHHVSHTWYVIFTREFHLSHMLYTWYVTTCMQFFTTCNMHTVCAKHMLCDIYTRISRVKITYGVYMIQYVYNLFFLHVVTCNMHTACVTCCMHVTTCQKNEICCIHVVCNSSMCDMYACSMCDMYTRIRV